MAKARWIGIFGGSFDPPHLGHLLAAIYALKIYEFDEVWFLPAYHHAFGKELTPFEHRFGMCQQLISGSGPKIKISSFEQAIRSDGRMLNTLLRLRKKHPSHAFSLIIGSDLLKERKRWFKFAEIENRFGVFTVPRGKAEKGTLPIPDIASSEIRSRLASRKPLGGLLTPGVASYISEHGLYRR